MLFARLQMKEILCIQYILEIERQEQEILRLNEKIAALSNADEKARIGWILKLCFELL